MLSVFISFVILIQHTVYIAFPDEKKTEVQSMILHTFVLVIQEHGREVCKFSLKCQQFFVDFV